MKLHLIILFSICFIANNLPAAGLFRNQARRILVPHARHFTHRYKFSELADLAAAYQQATNNFINSCDITTKKLIAIAKLNGTQSLADVRADHYTVLPIIDLVEKNITSTQLAIHRLKKTHRNSIQAAARKDMVKFRLSIDLLEKAYNAQKIANSQPTEKKEK